MDNPFKPCLSDWGQKWLRLDCRCAAIAIMAEEAESFCGRWYRNFPRPGLLVLAGDPNTGKSHTAAAINRFAIAAAFKAFEAGKGKTWARRVPGVSFHRWPEIVDGFKEGLFGVMDDLFGTELVILDDVGAEHDPSKLGASKLCQVLSRRETKFTVITTNIAPEEWPTRFDSRIADRFLRNSKIVSLFGVPSYALSEDC